MPWLPPGFLLSPMNPRLEVSILPSSCRFYPPTRGVVDVVGPVAVGMAIAMLMLMLSRMLWHSLCHGPWRLSQPMARVPAII